MAGISGWEALVLLLLVLLVVGPDRLPSVVEKLAHFLAAARTFIQGAKRQVAAELGDEIDLDVLDPRHYDPRRIVRDAWLDTDQTVRPAPRNTPGTGPAPFDDEAT